MNETFSIQFSQPLDASLLLPGLDLRVEQMTWCAEGGPQNAELSAELPCSNGSPQFPAGLLGLLRAGVKVFNAAAEPVWWGYLACIEIQYGQVVSRVDLDWLANRVAVQYWQRQAELEWQGEKTFTAWAEDGHSIGQFGIKERVYFLNSMLEEQAVAARDTRLADSSTPASRVEMQPTTRLDRSDSMKIKLVCRGWWETIGWRYAHLFDGYEGFVKAAQITQPLGRAVNSDALLAQSFQTSYGPWECGEIVVKLRQVGLCSDAVQVMVCADSLGSPDTSAPLGSQSVPASAIGGGLHWVRFVLPAPVLLQANTTYWIVLQRSGTVNSSNYYYLMREDSNPYPAGQLKNWNGSSWLAVSNGCADINFYVVGYKGRSQRIQELLGADLGGQFLSGVRLKASPSGNTLLWRDGTLTCLEELRELLLTGDADGRRLLGEVCADRSVLIRAMPAAGVVEYSLGLDGSLRTLAGSPVSLAAPVAGRRALLAPGWLDESVLISKTTWTQKGGLRVTVEEG